VTNVVKKAIMGLWELLRRPDNYRDNEVSASSRLCGEWNIRTWFLADFRRL